MSDWLLVLLVALATHRATRLVTRDHILGRPRLAVQEWFEDHWEQRTELVSDSDEWQSAGAYFLSCPFCMSVWIGGAIVAATAFTVGLPVPVLVWAAVSTAAGLLARLEGV